LHVFAEDIVFINELREVISFKIKFWI